MWPFSFQTKTSFLLHFFFIQSSPLFKWKWHANDKSKWNIIYLWSVCSNPSTSYDSVGFSFFWNVKWQTMWLSVSIINTRTQIHISNAQKANGNKKRKKKLWLFLFCHRKIFEQCYATFVEISPSFVFQHSISVES